MIGFLRRLLGRERSSILPAEVRDRADALRAVERARALSRRLRGRTHDEEYRIRVEVLRRGR